MNRIERIAKRIAEKGWTPWGGNLSDSKMMQQALFNYEKSDKAYIKLHPLDTGRIGWTLHDDKGKRFYRSGVTGLKTEEIAVAKAKARAEKLGKTVVGITKNTETITKEELVHI